MATKLILVRHGESTDNRAGIYQGWSNSHLTPLGKQQAELLAKRLAKERIDIVYASDLQRVQESIEPLRAFLPKTKIVSTPLLREQGKGTLEGKRHGEVENPPDWNYAPFGGEKHEELLERVERFEEEHLKGREGTICIYSHGGIIGQLCLKLLKLPEESFKEHHLSNASFHIIEIENGKARLVAKNVKEHQEGKP